MMIKVFPAYSDIFDDEANLDEILLSLPSKATLYVLAAVDSMIAIGWEQKKIFDFFFRRLPIDAVAPVFLKINTFFSKYQSEILIFQEQFLVELMVRIVDGYNDDESDTTPEQDLLIFKAYLLVADDFFLKQRKIFDKKKETSDRYLNRLNWPLQAAQIKFREPVEYKIFYFMKALVLIDELKHSNYAKYLTAYDEKVGLESENLVLTRKNISETSNMVGASREEFPSFFFHMDRNPDFLEHLILNPKDVDKDELKDVDYLAFRKYPLLRIDDKYFVILSRRLLWNGIYNGFIFDFYYRSGIKKELKSFPVFKTFLGDVMEKRFFEPILKAIFPKKHHVLCYGNGDGQPDAYVRVNNRIFLFEFKDYLFGKRSQEEKNYDSFIKEFENKFIQNKKGKAKGIGQLLNQIDYINANNGYEFDSFLLKKLKKERLTVFPVIVYTDFLYSMVGINNYLIDRFDGLKRPTVFKVRQPVMINLAFLFTQIPKLRKVRFDQLLSRYLSLREKNLAKLEKSASLKIHRDAIQSFDQVDFPELIITPEYGLEREIVDMFDLSRLLKSEDD